MISNSNQTVLKGAVSAVILRHIIDRNVIQMSSKDYIPLCFSSQTVVCEVKSEASLTLKAQFSASHLNTKWDFAEGKL